LIYVQQGVTVFLTRTGLNIYIADKELTSMTKRDENYWYIDRSTYVSLSSGVYAGIM